MHFTILFVWFFLLFRVNVLFLFYRIVVSSVEYMRSLAVD